MLALIAGVALPRSRAVSSRRVALLIQATAAPARPATPATADVDTTLSPKQLGFTMPGRVGGGASVVQIHSVAKSFHCD
jgi:hypothetical protein